MPSGSPLSVVRVAEDDWESYRDLRLAMLLDAPDAFWTTYADVADRDEAAWRRAATGVPCLQVRDEGGIPLGTLTVLLPAPARALYARHGFTPTGATLAHPRQPGVRELEPARRL